MLKVLEAMAFIKKLPTDRYEKIAPEHVKLDRQRKLVRNCLSLISFIDKIYFNVLRLVFYALIIVLHLMEKFVKPPAHLPALWFWIIDIIAFLVFGIIWIRSNIYLLYMVGKAVVKEGIVQKKID